jgi:flagellar basal body-associated protein FliL
MLKKGERPTKTIVPPKNLPVVEPKISQEAEKEATRQVFGEVMKEVKDMSQKKEDIVEPEREPIIQPSKPSALFPPEKDSKPAPIPPKPPKQITPIEPVKKVEKPKAPAPPVKKSKKGLFIALIAIIVLAAVGGAAYWWFFMRQPATHLECRDLQCVNIEGEGEDACQLNSDCLPPEPEKPLSLILEDGTETIEITSGQETEFLTNLRAAANKQTAEGSIRRILVKKVSSEESKYASLTELSNLMGITIPLALKSSFKDSYTLFVYTPKTEETDLCQGLNNLGCSGPRLGLVVSLADKTTAVGELVQWEETILSDLEAFILAETTGEAEFQYSTLEDLRGASFVRYANLPLSPISIDYGIKDDLLVISTSKNSFFEALGLLK